MICKLQAACNKYFRAIYYLDNRCNVTHLLKENKVLTANQVYNLEVAKSMFRANNNILPSPLQDVFYRNRRGNFPIRYSTSDFMMKSISHAGPKIWKSLTHECQNALSKQEFKSKTKAFLLNE